LVSISATRHQLDGIERIGGDRAVIDDAGLPITRDQDAEIAAFDVTIVLEKGGAVIRLDIDGGTLSLDASVVLDDDIAVIADGQRVHTIACSA
jgi:hypothetical protein